MCGIAGIFSTQSLTPKTEQHLDGMLRRLHHRGPDGRGKHLELQRGLAMGHTRLSIIDLDTGAQPLYREDPLQVLTVNGEFYDFKRYRSKAMAEGERFTCKSDSEIALSLYQKHGLDFVEHLRGEFAFALYDEKEDQLVLARDRFGIRPLFYHIRNNTVYYGSEVKALLAHPDIPAELDPAAAMNQMMQTIVPGSSAFKDIYSLKPGHMMIIKRRGEQLDIQEKSYWDFDFPKESDRDTDTNEAEHIERIQEKLIESIVYRLEADVPVGCYLSGGIDSCCILGLATGAMQSPVKAFTISFDSDDYDEAAIATEMGQSMNADHEMIQLKAEDLYGENYARTAWFAERTFYNTLGVAKMLMSQRVRECGYKTVITGEGADELFAGYPAFKRDMFTHGLQHEPESVRESYQKALEESNKLFKGAILSEETHHHPAWDALCGFTPAWIQPWIGTLDMVKPLFADSVQSSLDGYDPVGAIAEQIDGNKLEGRHPLDIAQYTWSKCQLEGQILNWGGDRVDMASSMESRPAFLDHHVAEAAVQVPPHLRIKGNTEKYVLREAVKGVLPESLYKREKFAFMAPPAHTDERKQKRLDALVEHYMSPERVDACGLFDRQRVHRFIEAYKSDTDPVSLTQKDTVLNHLLCLHILHAQYIEGETPGESC